MEINFFALPSFEHCTRTRRMRTSTRNWWATVLEKDVGTKMWSFQVRGYLDFDVEMENVGVFWSGTEALLLEYRWQTWDTFVSSLLWLFLNPAKNSSGWGRSRRCWRTTGSGSSSSGRRSRADWWRNLKLGEEGELIFYFGKKGKIRSQRRAKNYLRLQFWQSSNSFQLWDNRILALCSI